MCVSGSFTGRSIPAPGNSGLLHRRPEPLYRFGRDFRIRVRTSTANGWSTVLSRVGLLSDDADMGQGSPPRVLGGPALARPVRIANARGLDLRQPIDDRRPTIRSALAFVSSGAGPELLQDLKGDVYFLGSPTVLEISSHDLARGGISVRLTSLVDSRG